MPTQPYKLSGLLLAAILLVVGCDENQRKNDSTDQFELQRTVQQFHRKLRWSEFDKAARMIEESNRQEFLGRYEEYGDDLDIVDLEVKTVENLDTDHRKVQVEQKWLLEPDMTVNEDTYIEIWKRRGSGWMLKDRMKEKEWERRQEAGESPTDDSSDTGDSPSEASG
jgi:type II secretory pathway component PulJ